MQLQLKSFNVEKKQTCISLNVLLLVVAYGDPRP